VAEAVQPRAEKLVWVAADQRLQYGEVLKLISELKSDTQNLYVAIPTASQIGPVNPIEIERIKGKLRAALL
jgi:biopolymer transport protein ExbD